MQTIIVLASNIYIVTADVAPADDGLTRRHHVGQHGDGVSYDADDGEVSCITRLSNFRSHDASELDGCQQQGQSL